MWETAINLVIAIWLISTGLRHPYSPGVLIAAGTMITAFGFYVAAVWHSRPAFTIGMIGLWLFVSAIVAFMPPVNVITCGIVVAALSAWILLTPHPHEDRPVWS